MKWLVKLFFYGRVRRLERIGEAASLLAAGRIDEAEEILRLTRPRRWIDDFALFHFVSGKLQMEKGSLEEAERHLHAALALGLDRPSVKLNLAVLKVRQCNLGAALSILDEVDLSDDQNVLGQSSVMRRVIGEVSSGSTFKEISERSVRFRKKHLPKELQGDSFDAQKALVELSGALKNGKLSGKDSEDAVLFLGSLAVTESGGAWLLGLEPRDHRVLVGGLAWHPATQIDSFLAGDLESLSLPSTSRALAQKTPA
ncbi:MAG: hypothetical protein RBU30_00490 [Polyangia bacterium]|nr:hypothetical protein [Polyangia bacterium]